MTFEEVNTELETSFNFNTFIFEKFKFKPLSGSPGSAEEEIGAVLPGNSLSEPDTEAESPSDPAEVPGDNSPLSPGERTWRSGQ